MKTHRMILVLPVFVFAASFVWGQNRLPALLAELDRAIDSSGIYAAAKQHRIDLLKEELAGVDPESGEAYDINCRLIEEYRPFQADSTLALINGNIEWAERHGDRIRADRGRIMLIPTFVVMGFYAEAREAMLALDRERLDPSLMFEYYYAFYYFFEGVLYSPDGNMHRHFERNRRTYRDSLLSAYDINRADHDYATMSWLLYGWNLATGESLAIHEKLLADCVPYSHEYAKLAHRIATLYRNLGEDDLEIEYLALSAIADIRSAVRDQSSITLLSRTLYAHGNADHSYRYTQFAWKESLAFNSRLRLRNNAEIMSIVDRHQHELITKHNSRIRTGNYVISLALFLLILALVFSYLQNRKLKYVQEELRVAIDRLGRENEALTDANNLKVALVTQFMMQCSSHIKSLDSWRRMVYGKIVKGKSRELLNVSDEGELGKDLEEFYRNFDVAFLQMYPDFVRQFNDLLRREERIVLKKGEFLNPELRIFALILLGISDSSQIAELLHYSVNTIYNYRAKVKNKARVSRDQFENLVMKIR